MKKLRITVEGKTYEVSVEVVEDSSATTQSPSRPATARPAATIPAAAPVAPPTSAASAATGPGDVPSPLSGKIVSIDVKLGDPVEEGDQVATVEAMKMNTCIYAPTSGKVSAIHVQAGDGVEEGSPLLSIA